MSGQEKFDDMFKAIRQARSSIHLEYFNFRNDSIAGLLFNMLAEKASEGVEVRALFDSFGNASNNRPLRKRHLKAIRNKTSKYMNSIRYVSHGLTMCFTETTARLLLSTVRSHIQVV